jgi:hypothetical protein
MLMVRLDCGVARGLEAFARGMGMSAGAPAALLLAPCEVGQPGPGGGTAGTAKRPGGGTRGGVWNARLASKAAAEVSWRCAGPRRGSPCPP